MNIKNRLSFGLLLTLALTTTSSYAIDPHWTYDEEMEWGALENLDTTATIPALYPFAQCGIGQKQSPVNITDVMVNKEMNGIKPTYFAMPLSVNNNGHTIKVNAPVTANNNALFIGKERYELLQVHFHAPSEHSLKGVSYPLEMHLVHSTASGKLAVLGIFLKAGKFNSEFDKIVNNAPLSSGITNEPINEMFDVNYLLPTKKLFYNYMGSLTTPPCAEGVNWYVMNQVVEVSASQLAQMASIYSDNSRAAQALNGRIIESLW